MAPSIKKSSNAAPPSETFPPCSPCRKGKKKAKGMSCKTESVRRKIYCPQTEQTYEGEILASISAKTFVMNNETPLLYVKHGKGTMHDHKNKTTLTGFFQHDEIVGHALQVIYDRKGFCVLAQYEGTFHSSSDNSSQAVSTAAASKNYLRHGYGKYTWPSTGDIYVGEFKLGAMEGSGLFIWASGDRYEGKWKKGKMHGSSGRKLIASTGDEFVGTWAKGKASGWGRKNFGCGDFHEGMYRKDKRHGFGTYVAEVGDEYIGQYKGGRICGRGVQSLIYNPARGSTAVAASDESEDEAQEIAPQNGDVAEVFNGTFVNDEPQGLGFKIYACGDTFYGMYRDDQRHLYGVYTWSNGDIYEGSWRHGRMSGKGLKRMANGDTYDGEFEDNQANGFGVKKHVASRDIHIGEYQHDIFHGHGLYRWGNGNEYEGNYVHGDQHGLGYFKSNNGRIFFGSWHNGEKHGPGFLKVPQNSDSELIYFEVWSEGRRLHHERIFIPWDETMSLLDNSSSLSCTPSLFDEFKLARSTHDCSSIG